MSYLNQIQSSVISGGLFDEGIDVFSPQKVVTGSDSWSSPSIPGGLFMNLDVPEEQTEQNGTNSINYVSQPDMKKSSSSISSKQTVERKDSHFATVTKVQPSILEGEQKITDQFGLFSLQGRSVNNFLQKDSFSLFRKGLFDDDDDDDEDEDEDGRSDIFGSTQPYHQLQGGGTTGESKQGKGSPSLADPAPQASQQHEERVVSVKGTLFDGLKEEKRGQSCAKDSQVVSEHASKYLDQSKPELVSSPENPLSNKESQPKPAEHETNSNLRELSVPEIDEGIIRSQESNSIIVDQLKRTQLLVAGIVTEGHARIDSDEESTCWSSGSDDHLLLENAVGESSNLDKPCTFNEESDSIGRTDDREDQYFSLKEKPPASDFILPSLNHSTPRQDEKIEVKESSSEVTNVPSRYVLWNVVFLDHGNRGSQ
eukprot:c28658_g1_i1 orf=1277-2554(-)